MKRYYYLRGNLVEVDQLDGSSPSGPPHPVRFSAEPRPDLRVRSAVPGVDEESFAAFAAAGWRWWNPPRGDPSTRSLVRPARPDAEPVPSSSAEAAGSRSPLTC